VVHRRAFRTLLDRPEDRVLVVAHGLPIAYVQGALSGRDPRPVVYQIPYAEPFRLSAFALDRAVARLDAWARAPAW